MALESATYISGLNAANPVTGDAKTEGDDHIRLIKNTILNTFPNVTGAVTATHTTLSNALGSAQWSMSSDRLVNTGNTQPSFRAINSAAESASVNTFDTFTEVYDQGSHFNHTTGAFVAPVAGVYIFTFEWNVTFSNAGSALVEIYNSTQATTIGGAQADYLGTGSSGSLRPAIALAVARLAASDSVISRAGNFVNVLTSQCRAFTGHLLA